MEQLQGSHVSGRVAGKKHTVSRLDYHHYDDSYHHEVRYFSVLINLWAQCQKSGKSYNRSVGRNLMVCWTKSDDLPAEIWQSTGGNRGLAQLELLARVFQDFDITVDPGHRTIMTWWMTMIRACAIYGPKYLLFRIPQFVFLLLAASSVCQAQE